VSWHPTEDDIVLHYYGEHAGDEKRRIEDHVRICASCSEAWHQIRNTMAALDRVEVPEPDAAFDSRIWARVAAELPSHKRRWTLREVVLVGSWAAVVGVLVGAGMMWRAVQTPSAPPAAAVRDAAPGDIRERVLLTALNDHFSQTEMLLVEVMNAPDTTRERQFERATADDLVVSGRLYRETARQNGDVQLAAMLDDIEGVLAEIARSPAREDNRDMAALRTRIEDDDLLFKVRAVTTDVRGRRRALMQQP
jgi:hypothetical protein